MKKTSCQMGPDYSLRKVMLICFLGLVVAAFIGIVLPSLIPKDKAATEEERLAELIELSEKYQGPAKTYGTPLPPMVEITSVIVNPVTKDITIYFTVNLGKDNQYASHIIVPLDTKLEEDK